ncbi:uncharacterized protein T551_01577 [Pneumocystis jirovecii RU7]|uniref:Mitochondrial glyco protein n=1 Tax=Pneumocystis jirovecii (strain RU7) TaxID=1408657 RepID=A0A0W4ZRM7_PNEJ7|nr:uncharacterized protein T551_01577 [Pneumocystis jirovecii RU7]KTW31025.1 hypothetical protein T551_01577 [Pneumocystis jirovecii RU7]
MYFLHTGKRIFRLAHQHFLKSHIFTSKNYFFATTYTSQKARFSTNRPVCGYTSKELSTKLGSEIKHEISLMKEEIPENIRTFIDDGIFEIIDHQNSNEVELIRNFKNEKISITFSISDINNMESEDFYNHENENEQIQKEPLKTKELSEFEQEDTPFNFLVRCNIAITKPGSGALIIDAVAQDGTFVIDNILYYKDSDLALAQTAEADWQRRGAYMGPSFHSLDEDVQAMFERYLEERAINTSLALFIPEYVNYKEQKEYVNWLQDVKNFVDA